MSNKQMFTTSSNDKECGELKNIKYKTMLLNGAPENVCGKEDDMGGTFDQFMDTKQGMNVYKPWSKLDKVAKLDRLDAYVDTLSNALKPIKDAESETPLSAESKSQLKTYLKTALNRKKLQRVKEVVYDKEKGCIQDIPGLMMNKRKAFTLRREKKAESSLKSLAPKTGKTMKKTKKPKSGPSSITPVTTTKKKTTEIVV